MFEKIIQVLFLIIMTFGILGLPLFYYLNSRRKKLMTDDIADTTDDLDDGDGDSDECEKQPVDEA